MVDMPIVARFYGIIIKMYFNDHLPPHFHALYGEYNGIFDINSLDMLVGDLPTRARKMIVEWAQIHQAELKEMWDKQEFRKLKGLE